MKLPAPFIQLPLLFDAPALAAEIAALGETAWRPHPQGFAGNSMLPLVAVNGDAGNEAFAGAMAPTPELHRCPLMQQVLVSLQATVGRTRLMRLAGQAEVKRHVDQGYYWAERVRVHVPIVTQPTVRFECGDAVINMAAGECWIFDTWRQHRVLNDDAASRIHLVVDTVGGKGFWDLVAQGRGHAAAASDWQPACQPWAAPGELQIPCESRNVPAVMTPWELSAHLDFLFAETLPHANLPALHAHVERLLHEWRGLWARHGDELSARPQFRAAFDAFTTAAKPLSEGVHLLNETRWFDGVMLMLGRASVPPTAVARQRVAQQGD